MHFHCVGKTKHFTPLPLSAYCAGASEGATGPRHRDSGGTRLALSSLVSSDTSSAPVSASATPLQDRASEATESTRSGAPPHSETASVPPGLQNIRQTYQQSGLTGDSVELLMNSWRPTTTKAYNRYIRKWQDYVNRAKVDSPTHIDLASFFFN